MAAAAAAAVPGTSRVMKVLHHACANLQHTFTTAWYDETVEVLERREERASARGDMIELDARASNARQFLSSTKQLPLVSRPVKSNFQLDARPSDPSAALKWEEFNSFDTQFKNGDMKTSQLSTLPRWADIDDWITKDATFRHPLHPLVSYLLWAASTLRPRKKFEFLPFLRPCLIDENKSSPPHQDTRLNVESLGQFMTHFLAGLAHRQSTLNQLVIVLRYIFITNEDLFNSHAATRMEYLANLCKMLNLGVMKVEDSDSYKFVALPTPFDDVASAPVEVTEATPVTVKQALNHCLFSSFAASATKKFFNAKQTCLLVLNSAIAGMLNLYIELLHAALSGMEFSNNWNSIDLTPAEVSIVSFVLAPNPFTLRNEVHSRVSVSGSIMEYTSWIRTMKAIENVVGLKKILPYDNADVQPTAEHYQQLFDTYLIQYLRLRTFACSKVNDDGEVAVYADLIGTSDLECVGEKSKFASFATVELPNGTDACLLIPSRINSKVNKEEKTFTVTVPSAADSIDNVVSSVVDRCQNPETARRGPLRELPFYVPQLLANSKTQAEGNYQMNVFDADVHMAYLELKGWSHANNSALGKLVINQATIAKDRLLLVNTGALDQVTCVDEMTLGVTSHALRFTNDAKAERVAKLIKERVLAVYMAGPTKYARKGLGKREPRKRGAWATVIRGDMENVPDGDSEDASVLALNPAASAAAAAAAENEFPPEYRHIPRDKFTSALSDLGRDCPAYNRVTSRTWRRFDTLIATNKRRRESGLHVTRWISKALTRLRNARYTSSTRESMFQVFQNPEMQPRRPADFVYLALRECVTVDEFTALDATFQNFNAAPSRDFVTRSFFEFLFRSLDAHDTDVSLKVENGEGSAAECYQNRIDIVQAALMFSLVFIDMSVFKRGTNGPPDDDDDLENIKHELSMAWRVFITLLLQHPRQVQNQWMFNGASYGNNAVEALRDYWQSLLVELTRHYVTSLLRFRYDITAPPVELIGTPAFPLGFLPAAAVRIVFDVVMGMVAREKIPAKKEWAAEMYTPLFQLLAQKTLESGHFEYSRLLSPGCVPMSKQAMTRAKHRGKHMKSDMSRELKNVFSVFGAAFKDNVSGSADKETVLSRLRVGDAWWKLLTQVPNHSKTLHQFVEDKIQEAAPDQEQEQVQVGPVSEDDFQPLQGTAEEISKQGIAILRAQQAVGYTPLLFQTPGEDVTAQLQLAEADLAAATLATAVRNVPVGRLRELQLAVEQAWEKAEKENTNLNATNQAHVLHEQMYMTGTTVAIAEAAHVASGLRLEILMGSFASMDDYVKKLVETHSCMDAVVDELITQLAIRFVIRYLVACKSSLCPETMVMLLTAPIALQIAHLAKHVIGLPSGMVSQKPKNLISSIGLLLPDFDGNLPMGLLSYSVPQREAFAVDVVRSVIFKSIEILANTLRITHFHANSMDIKTSSILTDISDTLLDADAAENDTFISENLKQTPDATLLECATQIAGRRSLLLVQELLLARDLYNEVRFKAETADAHRVAFDADMVRSIRKASQNLDLFKHDQLRELCQRVLVCIASRIGDKSTSPEHSPLHWMRLAETCLVILTQINYAETAAADEVQASDDDEDEDEDEDDASDLQAYSKLLRRQVSAVTSGGMGDNARDLELMMPLAQCQHWANTSRVLEFLSKLNDNFNLRPGVWDRASAPPDASSSPQFDDNHSAAASSPSSPTPHRGPLGLRAEEETKNSASRMIHDLTDALPMAASPIAPAAAAAADDDDGGKPAAVKKHRKRNPTQPSTHETAQDSTPKAKGTRRNRRNGKTNQTNVVQGFQVKLDDMNEEVVGLINCVKPVHKFRIWFEGIDVEQWCTTWNEDGWGNANTFKVHKGGLPYDATTGDFLKFREYVEEVYRWHNKKASEADVPSECPRPLMDYRTRNEKAAMDGQESETKAQWLKRNAEKWKTMLQTFAKTRGKQIYFAIVRVDENKASAEVEWAPIAVSIPTRFGIDHPDVFENMEAKARPRRARAAAGDDDEDNDDDDGVNGSVDDVVICFPTNDGYPQWEKTVKRHVDNFIKEFVYKLHPRVEEEERVTLDEFKMRPVPVNQMYSTPFDAYKAGRSFVGLISLSKDIIKPEGWLENGPELTMPVVQGIETTDAGDQPRIPRATLKQPEKTTRQTKKPAASTAAQVKNAKPKSKKSPTPKAAERGATASGSGTSIQVPRQVTRPATKSPRNVKTSQTTPSPAKPESVRGISNLFNAATQALSSAANTVQGVFSTEKKPRTPKPAPITPQAFAHQSDEDSVDLNAPVDLGKGNTRK